MTENPAPETLTAEFDILMARAGLTIPDARRAAILAAYADMRGQIDLLHGRYAAVHEPSNVFRLTPAGDK